MNAGGHRYTICLWVAYILTKPKRYSSLKKKKLFGVDFFGTLGPALTPGSQCVDNKKKHVHVGMPY